MHDFWSWTWFYLFGAERYNDLPLCSADPNPKCCCRTHFVYVLVQLLKDTWYLVHGYQDIGLSYDDRIYSYPAATLRTPVLLLYYDYCCIRVYYSINTTYRYAAFFQIELLIYSLSEWYNIQHIVYQSKLLLQQYYQVYCCYDYIQYFTVQTTELLYSSSPTDTPCLVKPRLTTIRCDMIRYACTTCTACTLRA